MVVEADTDWLPVDDLLAAACNDMAVGQMVQVETFSLFEAMSAVELGNPKMDSTALATTTAEELIAQGLAPVDLTVDQQLAVMERLLHLETSHYCMASPLVASVYTSLYMMHPERLTTSCPLLFAFCEGLFQTCRAVRWLITHGAVSEEEDFSMLVTGLPCEAGVPAGGAAPIESSCLQTLRTAITLAEQLAVQQPDKASAYQAITARLQLRQDVHLALLGLKTRTAQSLTAASENLASALKALASCQAAPVPAGQLEAAPGFVEGLNRHLLGPAPPRSVKLSAPEECWKALHDMLAQLQATTQVAQASGFREVLAFIVRFSRMRTCTVARSAAHYLVAGSTWAAAAALPSAAASSTTGADSAAAPETPRAWALDRPLICEGLALPVSPVIGEEVELFLEQAAIALGNWVQAMLMNPCRQRRRLRRGLEDWANLYQHALNADLSPAFITWMGKAGWAWIAGQAGSPHPETGEPDMQGPLSTWVESHISSSQQLHLLLGFELDLYSPSEYTMLYWYASHLASVQRMDITMLHGMEAPAGGKLPLLPAASKQRKGKAKALPPPPPAPATVRRQAGLMADTLCVEVYCHTMSGLVRLMLALKKAGLVATPDLPFNTQRERFDQRFGSFHAPSLVKPEPLHHDHFLASVESTQLGPDALMLMSVENFATVRKVSSNLNHQRNAASPTPLVTALSEEQLAEIAILDRTAASNSLAAGLLARMLAENQPGAPLPMSVTFDFSQHPYFPTLKVKSKK